MGTSTAASESFQTSRQQALADLADLTKDVEMLASGEWVPDQAGCDATLAAVNRVRQFVAGLGL